MIMERNYAPVIVFSFSKKECEAYATQMAKLDFNTGESGNPLRWQSLTSTLVSHPDGKS